LATKKPIKKDVENEALPQMVAFASEPVTSTRRNIAGTIERTNRFSNIDQGLVPFRYSSSVYGQNMSTIDVRDAVVLCQKCYYNFSLFRNIIDIMTEFSVSPLVYKGGSKQSRNFFEAFWNKMNIWDFQDKFFREYYRSGNVFTLRYDGKVQPEDVKKITQVFAADSVPDWGTKIGEYNVEKMVLPSRYIILNPADIQMMSSLNFAYGLYFKVLTDFELAQLRNPKNKEDQAIFESLPEEAKNQIKKGSRAVAIPLDPNKISMVFYKRQDYEPFAVPMGYPVLEDINFKAEMRKIDMAIARTMQQMVLLVTAGTEPDKGGVNAKNIEALRKLFENQSVGRVLIADYTTKAEFVIPAIADLLDPKKYQTINEDINVGLNNVFASDNKFANQQQKVEIFISRLEQGRQAFLNSFLIPEMKRIAQSVGFKNYPTPEFEDIDLKDDATMNKIYARLVEIGVLTAEQGFKALSTGLLPDYETLEDEQTTYKEQRDKGLYVPLIGGKTDPAAGRPAGSTAPQTTKKIGPIGTSSGSEKPIYSVVKVKENMVMAQQLETRVMAALKEKHNIKRFSKLQKEVATGMVEMIMANEEPSRWLEKVQDYCDKPEDTNHTRVTEVNKIAVAHQLDNYLASLLLASKVENA
jgi:hypothetical protein